MHQRRPSSRTAAPQRKPRSPGGPRIDRKALRRPCRTGLRRVRSMRYRRTQLPQPGRSAAHMRNGTQDWAARLPAKPRMLPLSGELSFCAASNESSRLIPSGAERRWCSRMNELPGRRLDERLRTCGHAQLSARVLQMKFDRALAQAQDRADFAECLAARGPRESFHLALTETDTFWPHGVPRNASEARRDHRGKHVVVDGLGEIVVGAEFPPLELALVIAESREKDKGHALEARLHRCQPVEQLETRHSRHADVGQHQIRRVLENRRQTVTTIAGDADLEAAIDEFFADQGRGIRIVLDAQNF